MRQNIWQLAVASLAIGLMLTPAQASPPVKPTPAKSSAAAANAHAELVTALHQAKTLLETAIHDYDGHRAKAVGEIHHAIHELTPHHKHVANAEKAAEKPANGAATTTPGENQAQSDKQLKQALQILSGVGGQIPKHHAKAAGHITTAIEELNIALKIK